MSAVSALSAGMTQFTRSPFARLDADSNGQVTKAEFVTGRPRGISEADSTALYDKIDSDGVGALNEEQLKAGLEANRPARPLQNGGGMSGGMLSALLTTLQQGGSSDAPPSSDEQYDAMDADGDGIVTQAEFVAARPEELSEEEATAFYDSIDMEGAGSITREQFAAARSLGGPGGSDRPHGPPPDIARGLEATESSNATESTASASATDLVSKLLGAIKAYAATADMDTAQLTDLLLNA